MPYFVRIGAIDSNVSGVGSRGYHLFRRGRTVVVRWGPVVVVRGRKRKFRWVSQQQKVYRLRTPEEARADCVRRIAERENTYSRLPRGVSIVWGRTQVLA